MLNFNENEGDSINLDKEPLVIRNKLIRLLSVKPIHVNECYFKMTMNYDEQEDNYHLKMLNNRQETEENNLLSIFVVSFDIRHGNLIEWQLPKEIKVECFKSLENVEFKAIASGLHLMVSDVVYFCKDNMYGLGVFESLRGDFTEERNCRMKSVGVMAKSFKSLRNYLPFLRRQVKKKLLIMSRKLLDQSADYSELEELWFNKNSHSKLIEIIDCTQIVSNSVSTFEKNDPSFVDKILTKIFDSKLAKQLNSVNQSDYRIYTRLALHFGPALFSLWKCVLLNKRILFCSRPPIGDLCYQVYCSSQLGNTSFNFASEKSSNYLNEKQLIKPFFFVNISDIDTLKEEPFYIACTTEDIFENKCHLYDIFVKDVSITAVLAESQKSLLKVTSADKKRYDILMKRLSPIPIQARSNDYNDDEEVFLKFFTELNDSIFFSLSELAEANLNYRDEMKRNEQLRHFESHHDQPNLIDNQQIKKMNLDPTDERDFLNELIRFYDFNLTLNF